MSRIDRIQKLKLVVFFMVLPLALYVDGTHATPHAIDNQLICNVLWILVFSWIFKRADLKVRRLMAIMVFVGLCGEIIGSIILELYRYRLHNIPVYVPFGHAILYSQAYYFCRLETIKRYRKEICYTFGFFSLSVCTYSLVFMNDIFGLICFIFFVIMCTRQKNKLFYLCMFMYVYYLEILGTHYGVWAWYNILENHPNYPTTANPPAGIAGGYVIFDMTVNNLYVWLVRFKSYTRAIAKEVS